jgi:hypothetical protein
MLAAQVPELRFWLKPIHGSPHIRRLKPTAIMILKNHEDFFFQKKS